MKKMQIIVGVLVGIVCLGFAVLYWTTPPVRFLPVSPVSLREAPTYT